MLTGEQIERLEALLAKVPQGAWECHGGMLYSVCLPDGSYLDTVRHPASDEKETAARDLIVAAVNALPALLQLARAVNEAPQARMVASGHSLDGSQVRIVGYAPVDRADYEAFKALVAETVALVPVPVKEGL